ncbi:hypothetical protein ACFVQ4_10600 [Streptomyces laurentii]|uniref:hypothetical protein n=1 Tax=Streptomyces laurentii TaxID=39478 RepID=UPI0036C54413
MHPAKRTLWSLTALGAGLTGWVPFLYLALTRKAAHDRGNLALHAGVCAVVFTAMLVVADQRDNASAVVGFAMCAAALAAAVHAWVELGRTPASEDDAVTVAPNTGRDFL